MGITPPERKYYRVLLNKYSIYFFLNGPRVVETYLKKINAIGLLWLVDVLRQINLVDIKFDSQISEKKNELRYLRKLITLVEFIALH